MVFAQSQITPKVEAIVGVVQYGTYHALTVIRSQLDASAKHEKVDQRFKLRVGIDIGTKQQTKLLSHLKIPLPRRPPMQDL